MQINFKYLQFFKNCFFIKKLSAATDVKKFNLKKKPLVHFFNLTINSLINYKNFSFEKKISTQQKIATTCCFNITV